MYNSMFGAGKGSAAFAYDMMVMDDIEKNKNKNKKSDVNHVVSNKRSPKNATPKKVGVK